MRYRYATAPSGAGGIRTRAVGTQDNLHASARAATARSLSSFRDGADVLCAKMLALYPLSYGAFRLRRDSNPRPPHYQW
jgi:hypothetical protein